MRPLCRILAAALLIGAGPTHAQNAQSDACSGYKWDVSKERALFAEPGRRLPAGKERASTPAIRPGELYVLELSPLSQVSFPLTPGRTPPSGSYAGLVAITVPSAGHYRIAVDQPLWVDVAGGMLLAPAVDYEGMHDCDAPRKVVEFDLEGRTEWILQISAADRPAVRLTATRVR